MMNLIKKKGSLRGLTVLCALVGLLVSAASTRAEDSLDVDASSQPDVAPEVDASSQPDVAPEVDASSQPGVAPEEDASSQPDTGPEEDAASLRLKLDSMTKRFTDLCEKFSHLEGNCSDEVIDCHCPEGWFVFGDHCYFLGTDKDNYDNSTNRCVEEGAHLAILTTKEQHDAVKKEAQKIPGLYTYYWIGLTDREHEGEWKWADNTNVTEPFWKDSEADIKDPSTEQVEGHCAVLSSLTEEWSEAPCAFSYPRICQKNTFQNQ